MTELKNAMKTVLTSGYHLSKSDLHLYPVGTSGFRLLKFDDRGNINNEVDEFVNNIDAAISRLFELRNNKP